MRPRRRLLITDAQEERRGITRFVLDLWRYHVIVAADVLDAAAILADCDERVDLVIAFGPMTERTIAGVAARHAVPSLMVGHGADDDDGWCDAVIANPRMVELIEKIKVMTRRKRGPRKGFKAAQRKPVMNVLGVRSRKAVA